MVTAPLQSDQQGDSLGVRSIPCWQYEKGILRRPVLAGVFTRSCIACLEYKTFADTEYRVREQTVKSF